MAFDIVMNEFSKETVPNEGIPSECTQKENLATAKADVIDIDEKCWQFEFCNELSTPPINVERLKQGTFFVTNMGGSSINIILETSADSYNWVKDNQKIIPAKSTDAVVGMYYGKYYRLRIRTAWYGKVSIKFIAQLYSVFQEKQTLEKQECSQRNDVYVQNDLQNLSIPKFCKLR